MNKNLQTESQVRLFIKYYLDTAPPQDLELDYEEKRTLTDFHGLDYILDRNKNTCKIYLDSLLIPGKLETEIYIKVDTRKGTTSINQFLKKSGIKFSLQLTECIKRGNKIIAIPVNLDFEHQNAIIYRVEENVFEYFEPHGARFLGDDYHTELIEEFMIKLLNYLVSNKTIPSKYIFKNADVLCPLSLYRGLQLRQSYNIFYKNVKAEGLCVIWTYFFIDMCLRFPSLSGNKLTNITINYLENQRDNFQKLIVSYLYHMLQYIEKDKKYDLKGEALYDLLENKYYSETGKGYSEFMKKVEKPQYEVKREVVKEVTKKVDKGKCLNFKTSTESDILYYLQSDSSNIVLNIDNNLGCYNRKDISSDLQDSRFLNNIEIDDIIYFRIYPEIFVSKDDFITITMEEKYVFYNLKFVQFLKSDSSKIPIYSLDAYTMDEYLSLDEPTTIKDSFDKELIKDVIKSDVPSVQKQNSNKYITPSQANWNFSYLNF